MAAVRAQAQPVPLPPDGLPLLDVPFVSQSEALCGGAAAAMVLRYWGERGVTAETFAPLVDRSAAGIRTTTLVGDLIGRGWAVRVVDGDRQLIADTLTSARPLLALIEDRPRIYHYIVIVGITERAVIFHDPARAPFRVMARNEFEQRSRTAGRWMAIVVPAAPRSAPPVGAVTDVTTPAASTCEERVRAGVAQAQAGQLEASERTLAAALTCPGASPLRELAGVRLLQRRWDEVAQLSQQAAVIDPGDEYTWKLLGTSRFLLNQPSAALDAWNHIGEPRLDLVKVNGLERTRQRPVERLVGIAPGEVISSNRFGRAQRALRELPSARSTRLEFVPVGQGLAELHITLAERPLVPRDVWSLAAIGARATINRTVGITFGSASGAGESLSVDWRYWPARPAVSASFRAPAGWPGTWGADVFAENQEFDSAQPEVRRRGGRFTASRWMTRAVRIDLRGGAERWNDGRTRAAIGTTTGFLSAAEHFAVTAGADGWIGSDSFASFVVGVTASSVRSGTSGAIPLGAQTTVTAGAAAVSRHTPLDLWLAADTGQVRSVLARAHPLLDTGRMRVERLGRRLVYGSAEAAYWWKAPALSRIGAVVFADSVRTMTRTLADSVADVDVGGGIGLASLLAPGRLRIDFAHGLRDGADAVSVRYVTAMW